ncbi:MAG: beta-Ala-His dipeptidase [Mogibacterium sp.]|nr:beta-Ala-His dipeptidase [Mogibacterium sp.]
METKILAGLKPKEFFGWFEEICQHPHGSYHEKPLSDYLYDWAKGQGYEVKQDKDWNLVIDVPATPGMEDRPKVMLQGHIDMVCNKVEGSTHDFLTDPIQIYEEDGWITAKGTTLGADNGIAVAAFLAIVSDPSNPHPPLQLVLTAMEEVACVGAVALDPDWLDAKYLINLDVFHDDVFMVSCGGITANRAELPVKRIPVSGDVQGIRINITGLRGGHSGELIHEGRANAIRVIDEVLFELKKSFDYGVIDIRGEGVFNAICAIAGATICVPKADADAALTKVKEIGAVLSKAYIKNEPGLGVEAAFTDVSPDATVLDGDLVDRLIKLLYVAPMGMNTPGDCPVTVADSSSTFGVLGEEDGVLRLTFSIRSNPEYRQDQVFSKYQILCDLLGAELYQDRRIVSWEYVPDSKLRDAAVAVYERLFGEAPRQLTVHFGNEVGTIVGKMIAKDPTFEAIAFGFEIEDAHAPLERLSIASAQKSYKLLQEILKAI